MENSKGQIRVGVVGTSGYAGYLIERMWELPQLCQVVAATSLDAPDHPSVVKCRERGVTIYPTLDALLQSTHPSECDAIVVATGIDSHYRYIAQALQAGFNVFLEKPPVPTIQELDALIRMQRKTGLTTAVHFQHLYDTSTHQLKQYLMSGRLGKVRRVRGMAGWPRPVSYFQRSAWSGKLHAGANWVLDGTVANPLAHLVAHELFLATTIPGLAEPASVQAELYRANAIEGEDTASLRIMTTEGVEILFFSSLTVQNQLDVSVEIETSEAIILQDKFDRTVIVYNNGQLERLGGNPTDGNDDERQSRLCMLTTIFEAMRSGKPQPFSLAACRPYVVALNAAFESNGIPHPIPSEFTQTLNSNLPRRIVVADMETSLQQAFNKRALFSESGARWAKPSPVFPCKGYGFFPAHPDLSALHSHTIRTEGNPGKPVAETCEPALKG